MEPTGRDNASGRQGGRFGGGPRFYAFRQGGGPGGADPGMQDGRPLRRMIGGISALMVIAWTLLWLAFYALIELVGNVLVWLARTVFHAPGTAHFFAGIFGFLQDLGFVTVFIVWLIGVALAIGFNLVTHRATRDAEARWSQRHGDHARPVDGEHPPGRARPGPARPRRKRPMTIDLRRDGDTYR